MKTILLLTLAFALTLPGIALADFSEDYAFYMGEVLRESAAENRHYRQHEIDRLTEREHERRHPRHRDHGIVIVVPHEHHNR